MAVGCEEWSGSSGKVIEVERDPVAMIELLN